MVRSIHHRRLSPSSKNVVFLASHKTIKNLFFRNKEWQALNSRTNKKMQRESRCEYDNVHILMIDVSGHSSVGRALTRYSWDPEIDPSNRPSDWGISRIFHSRSTFKPRPWAIIFPHTDTFIKRIDEPFRWRIMQIYIQNCLLIFFIHILLIYVNNSHDIQMSCKESYYFLLWKLLFLFMAFRQLWIA